jgi:hypothetical protein
MNIDRLLTGDAEEVDFALEEVRHQLANLDSSSRDRIKEKMFLAALGSIPWIGGVLAAAGVKLDEAGAQSDRLRAQWLEGHRKKLQMLRETLDELARRIDGFGEALDERIQSEEFLLIVRKAFRVWDAADTSQKRRYAAILVTNAAATRVCSDDVVRLFIDWLDSYHEAHFAVIQYVFDNPGCTRYNTWTSLYGAIPRDDSAEADLFKRLIRDLNIDGVIRQERDVTDTGQYRRLAHPSVRKPAAKVLETPFENTKGYELTALGKQFVHYTMNEAVKRLGDAETTGHQS